MNRGVVKKVLSSGKTAGQVARELDLTHTAVRHWVKQAHVDRGKGTPGALTTAEKEELAQLRKEVRELREDRGVLQSAGASLGHRLRYPGRVREAVH